MDKFINKDGKVVLEIDDEGNEKIDLAYFRDITDEELIQEFERRFGKKNKEDKDA